LFIIYDKEKKMTLLTFRWIAGAIILFLGRELTFLFSGSMAIFIGARLTGILPASLPPWGPIAFVVILAAIAVGLSTLNKDAGFITSGFFAGGYIAAEYFAQGSPSLPIVPFILGAIIGAILLGATKDWGTIAVSSLIGIYMIYDPLPLFGTAKTLATAGIFILGALVQVIVFQTQKH